jgi:hypothetical protein
MAPVKEVVATGLGFAGDMLVNTYLPSPDDSAVTPD